MKNSGEEKIGKMKIENNLDLARHLAKRAFEGKKDKAGRPYFEHLERVANAINLGYDTDFYRAVAYLHDILEDCPEWNYETLKVLFSESIADCVKLMTHDKGTDYMTYIRNLKAGDHKLYYVKIADLRDNMDITRLLYILNDTDLKRLKKYHDAYRFLTTTHPEDGR